MSNSKHKQDGYIDRSPKGFGKRNGISERTVYNELSSGRLKGKKIGARTIITDAAEQAWIDALPDAEYSQSA